MPRLRLLESLPRLLLLHQHLTGPTANLTVGALSSANLTHQGGQGGQQGWTLILPAGRAGFFRQSLSLVVRHRVCMGHKGSGEISEAEKVVTCLTI